MMINSLPSVEPIQRTAPIPAQVGEVRKPAGDDTIAISATAREKSEIYRVMDMMAQVPDIRADRIAEIRQKINDPTYLNSRVLSATADKLIDVLLA
ncbi:MAG: flagellar biosynthesis anti-sigma factor FlgM [Treponema sp.]|jgi:negative regulator of flagellin synthesis FlgM|nr:flagellar biosynthesis anti-sigma factor FlgM [Treponema sp.]